MMTTKPLAADGLRGAGLPLWTLVGATVERQWHRVVALRRALRARREIARLQRFSDRELKDIGLTRSDVAAALSLPLHQDPSRKLAALIATRGVAG